MKNKALIVAALMSLATVVQADFRTVARAYEVALSEFRVAPMENGSVFFRQCPDCEAIRVRVTPATNFVVNGESVPLREFRKSIFQINDRAGATVIVLHHLETDVVLSVSITI